MSYKSKKNYSDQLENNFNILKGIFDENILNCIKPYQDTFFKLIHDCKDKKINTIFLNKLMN